MTHDEILERMQAVKKGMGWTNLNIEARTNGMLSQSSVAKVLRGENVRLFTFLDMLDALGLEIRVI